MDLKNTDDLTGDQKHTCDCCQKFVTKETYLQWRKDTDFSEGYPIGEPLFCGKCC